MQAVTKTNYCTKQYTLMIIEIIVRFAKSCHSAARGNSQNQHGHAHTPNESYNNTPNRKPYRCALPKFISMTLRKGLGFRIPNSSRSRQQRKAKPIPFFPRQGCNRASSMKSSKSGLQIQKRWFLLPKAPVCVFVSRTVKLNIVVKDSILFVNVS